MDHINEWWFCSDAIDSSKKHPQNDSNRQVSLTTKILYGLQELSSFLQGNIESSIRHLIWSGQLHVKQREQNQVSKSPASLNDIWDTDLDDLTKYAINTVKQKYVLDVIDIFSQKLYVSLLTR